MIQRKKLFATFVRFGMVGALATALHYGLYYLLHFIMGANAAFTVGYPAGVRGQLLPDVLFYLRHVAFVAQVVRHGGGARSELPAANRVIELFSLDGGR